MKAFFDIMMFIELVIELKRYDKHGPKSNMALIAVLLLSSLIGILYLGVLGCIVGPVLYSMGRYGLFSPITGWYKKGNIKYLGTRSRMDRYLVHINSNLVLSSRFIILIIYLTINIYVHESKWNFDFFPFLDLWYSGLVYPF